MYLIVSAKKHVPVKIIFLHPPSVTSVLFVNDHHSAFLQNILNRINAGTSSKWSMPVICWQSFRFPAVARPWNWESPHLSLSYLSKTVVRRRNTELEKGRGATPRLDVLDKFWVFMGNPCMQDGQTKKRRISKCISCVMQMKWEATKQNVTVICEESHPNIKLGPSFASWALS